MAFSILRGGYVLDIAVHRLRHARDIDHAGEEAA